MEVDQMTRFYMTKNLIRYSYIVLIAMALSLTCFTTANATNWVYVSAIWSGSSLYYDSQSVTIDRNNRTFSVTSSIVFSYTDREIEIDYAVEDGYYYDGYEDLDWTEEGLTFHYDSNTVDVTFWGCYDKDGVWIDDGSGPYSQPINNTYGRDLIYQRVKSDYSIY
jgi:hypothetical protein